MAHEEQDAIDGWRTYANWIDNIRNNSEVIAKFDSDDNFERELLACGTNLKRFQYVWSNQAIKDEMRKTYNDDLSDCRKIFQARPKKSIEESIRYRELGNKSFKNSEFDDALNHYSMAARMAPYPSPDASDDSLALALANRSAVLFALKRYRLCLVNINLAIKYGFPKASLFKLLIRKVKCLHILSVWANDFEEIKDDLKKMLKSKETTKQIKTEIQNMFDFIEHSNPEEMEKDEYDQVDEATLKIPNACKTVSQAVDSVEMSHDEAKGRYLLVNKDVAFGRLLLAEDPFAANLAPSERNNYCYNCLGSLHSCGLPCRKCTQVLYCSEKCYEIKEKVHDTECNEFLELHDKLGVTYLVAHILLTIDFDITSFTLHTKKHAIKKTLDQILSIPTSDWPDYVHKNNYPSVLSLMDHASDYGYDEMMGYSLTAVYMLIAFVDQFSDRFPMLKEDEYQLAVGSVILRHLLQLQTNLISILDQNHQDLVVSGHNISNMQEKPIGIGLYPTVSLLNHSCGPNIISLFHRGKFVARAGKTLESGTEVTYCYGPSVFRQSKKDRQNRLKEQYFFTCECDFCKNDKEHEGRALCCPECSGPVIYNQDSTNHCLGCKQENLINVKEYLARLARLQAEVMGPEDQDPSQQIKNLKRAESDLNKVAYWKHSLFIQIKLKLIESAELLENLDLILKFCLEELELCDRTHGGESYESLMTRIKLINTKWQKLYYQSEECETVEARKPVLQELKTLLTTVNTLKSKLRELLAATNITGAETSFDNELRFLRELYGYINRYITSQEE